MSSEPILVVDKFPKSVTLFIQSQSIVDKVNFVRGTLLFDIKTNLASTNCDQHVFLSTSWQTQKGLKGWNNIESPGRSRDLPPNRDETSRETQFSNPQRDRSNFSCGAGKVKIEIGSSSSSCSGVQIHVRKRAKTGGKLCREFKLAPKACRRPSENYARDFDKAKTCLLYLPIQKLEAHCAERVGVSAPTAALTFS